MLSSIIAEEVKRCIEDFLLTTYPVQEPFFDNLFDNLFDNFFKANKLFRGTSFTPENPRERLEKSSKNREKDFSYCRRFFPLAESVD